MTLSETVESLLNDLGAAKLNESTLKGRLAHIQEQAKAQETELEKIQAELKHAEARITELELKLHKQEDTPQGESLEQDAERMLKAFFDVSDAIVVEYIASELGLIKGVADHYADVLSGNGLIDLCAATPGGVLYIITPKGRAYVMKNLLNK